MFIIPLKQERVLRGHTHVPAKSNVKHQVVREKSFLKAKINLIKLYSFLNVVYF